MFYHFQEQNRRKAKVAAVCREHGNILSPSTTPFTFFSYIPQYNLLYCRIQKCGTTNWFEGTLARLAPLLGLKNYLNQTRREKRKNFEVKSLESWAHIMDGMPLTFVNVRHPFERLASGRICNIIQPQFIVKFPTQSQHSLKTKLALSNRGEGPQNP